MAEPLALLLTGAIALVLGAGIGLVAGRRLFLERVTREQSLREEITSAIEQARANDAVEKEDRDRILGALDLAERTVDEIMLHRSRIEKIDADMAPAALLDRVLSAPHTRLPLFRGDDEHILGVVHAKDLLREVHRLGRSERTLAEALDRLDITRVARRPYFIPETTTLDEQMRQFLARRTHFALVVDEYGELRGLLTLEDILEEIVGEITDEFDIPRDETEIRKDADGAWLVNGAMTIRDLNRALEWNLPDDAANTIAGLVVHEARIIPAEGQVFSFHGCRFTIIERVENRITRLKIRRLSP